MIATDDAPALDDLIPLRELAAKLPRRRGGRKTHVATLYRWTDRGIRGNRLRYVRAGSVRCSTLVWVHEFFAALAAPVSPAAAPPAARTPAARARAVTKADADLAAMGL